MERADARLCLAHRHFLEPLSLQACLSLLELVAPTPKLYWSGLWMNGRPGEGLECHFRHTLSGRMDGGFWLHNFPMFIIFLRAKRRDSL
jgi:hypothetical protein